MRRARWLAVTGVLLSACGGGGTMPTTASGPSGGGADAATSPIGGTTPSSPTATGAITATVAPNPVPFSGAPIAGVTACAGVANTWFYTQTLTETGGASITITTIVDRIDGAILNNFTNQRDVLQARGALTYGFRWCFQDSNSRTIQTTFSGVDANGHAVTVTGPAVTLQSRAGSTTPTAALVVTVSPNPSPFSGAPITNTPVCAGVANTWFYTQTVTETLGVSVTITTIVDFIDGNLVNNFTGQNDVVPARRAITYNFQWCFTTGISRTVQTTFSGVDTNGRAVTAIGPVVTLQARPGAGVTTSASGAGGGQIVRTSDR